MTAVQDVLDEYADDAPYERLARGFLEFERPTGQEPLLLLAEAAASTTGQGYATGVRATVDRVRETVVDPGRVHSFSELAALEVEDDDLVAAFGAQRKRRVFLEAARVLADRPEDDDLAALRSWAGEADVYRYDRDPIGAISGVGPASFQYLRLLAGIDTAKPDPEVTALIEAVAEAADDARIDATTPLRAVAACEWLAVTTSYRRIEIDQLAWWTFADEREREALTERGYL